MHKSTHYWVCCVPSCENWHFSYLSEVATKNVLIIKISFHFSPWCAVLASSIRKIGKRAWYSLYMHWDNHLTYNATLFTSSVFHQLVVGGARLYWYLHSHYKVNDSYHGNRVVWYTYIDKDSMDVVRMFPLKKNTPAVSYRGGGGRRYSIEFDLFHLTLLSVQQLTLLCITLNANQRTKSGEV